ncbi:MAG TPA: RIP metalloprotease RseP [Candidatus Eisenbacteria bacterium]|nr:RIP metalloprotease RseP [Candidatus Eisenbacteria bacterium]
MSNIASVVLYGALILGVLVFVHELGHFLAAKWLGVRVISFSIGMGPRVFGFTRGGTDYRISLLPLGGYVRMAGDTTEGEERVGSPDEFLEKAWWARALISVAGPAANFVFALFVYMALYLGGITTTDYTAHVGGVKPGSEAEKAGLRGGDFFVSWDGQPAATMATLSAALDRMAESKETSAPVAVTVEREGSQISLQVPRAAALQVTEGIEWGTETEIGRVLIGLPAYSAGLLEGDRVKRVDGVAVTTWNELARALRSKPGALVTLDVKRGDRDFAVQVKTTPEGQIGVSPPELLTYHQTFPPLRAIQLGVLQTVGTVGQIYAGLWSLVSDPGRIGDSVAGPIAISQVARQTAASGIHELIRFGAFISLALMAMNLLPIPILDGGHILFSLIEGIRRRPLSERTQLAFQRVGLFLLVSLVVFSFYNDLNRVNQRKRAEAEISKRLSGSAPADTAASPGHP